MKLVVPAFLLIGLMACGPAAPQNNLSLRPGTVVLDEAEVESVTPSGMSVQTDKELSSGQIVISAEGEGLVRRIAEATSSGAWLVGGQAVRKFYLKTEDASLEEAIASGQVTLESDLPIGEANMTQALPGVSVQNFTGRINLTNVRFDIPGVPGAAITLNGFLEQTLRPSFSLRFSSGSVEVFRVGMSGALKAQVTAAIQADASYGSFSHSKELASWNIKKAFLVGGVPVVVVLQPKLVAGVSSQAGGKVTVSVSIAPTFSTNVQLDYNRNRAANGGWNNTFAADFSLNPSLNYSVPVQGMGQAFVGLAMGVKFYGMAGPSLEAKPFINLTLSGNSGAATLKSGISGSSKVEAGFKVLGKGLETAYNGPTFEEARTFSCQAPNTCTTN
ncbi:MAG: hypothetical protein NZ849_05565 [Meiothermus sp.]|uniref:hypothetical protein n=1 Tax=Meiothermus sp. TaxID=1955249 RepID=UPI0025E27840|nr:hypothetical protein [Meiothermus sp.]MCS7058109.1 hypothetical protein [Meiothermus sp.]MCS7194368.1 hypothetical protein [Meiothermus sp.]MCX7740278.1 hypothetical protein [Meiothermus sp.]MDW8089849.1 hypothetical protein [Meiothermus sp.]MDW8481725.1 hypothetical protein [Meiothermus sp.]